MPQDVSGISHHIIIVDLDDGRCFAVQKVTDQQLLALADCENYVMIDPLLNQQYNQELHQWEPIPIGHIHQDNSIVYIREVN